MHGSALHSLHPRGLRFLCPPLLQWSDILFHTFLQSEAVIAAREKIVQGAVSMVDMALAELSAKNVVDLDDERKAAMVSNLMVVLCGESDAQPVLNTGTLYQ